MPRRSILQVLILAALACLPASPDEKVSDDEIYDKVRLKLASDRDVRGMAIEVHVEQGVVTLRGRVDKEKARKRAEKLAKQVKGVVRVVNELRVAPL
jgi:osmotically-inducible protein OsmY